MGGGGGGGFPSPGTTQSPSIDMKKVSHVSWYVYIDSTTRCDGNFAPN